jgi:hypothetical protein
MFNYSRRRFAAEHGDGEIFSFDLCDDTGEITAVAFYLLAHRTETSIERGKVSQFHQSSFELV